jgi:bifunctional DNA-binding transcriptional regulator/antitoxin component of YhaV-PrlF toxin-antitoxin module
MTTSMSLSLGQRGVLTLPKSLREQYSLQPGNLFTLLDLGGVFVLSPKAMQIDELSAKITKSLVEKGEDLEGMLRILREQRERYGGEDPDLP